jgi:hypothetical protein
MLCVPIGKQWPNVWLGAAERGSLSFETARSWTSSESTLRDINATRIRGADKEVGQDSAGVSPCERTECIRMNI